MGIYASASITLTKVVDVKGVYRYYLLQSSTLAKPSKPTTNPPSGWDDVEPTYVEGSTNTLYTVDITVFSDDTWSSSEVSMSSSYEAAKVAYNKAHNAQISVQTLSDSHAELEQTVDGLTSTVSGHTTLIANKADQSEVLSVTNQLSTLEQNLNGFKTTVSSTYANRYDLYRYNLLDNSTDEWKAVSIPTNAATIYTRVHCSKYGLQAGDTITFSLELRTEIKSGLKARMDFYSEASGETGKTANMGNVISKGETGMSSVTATIPTGAEYITLMISNDNTSETTTVTEYYRKPKLEKGAYATEWVPAITSLIDIGGANYLSNSYIHSSYAALKDGGTYYSSSTSTRQLLLFQNLYLEPGTYTISCYIKLQNGDGTSVSTQVRFRLKQNSTNINYDVAADSGDWELCTIPLEVASAEDNYTLYLRTYDTSSTNVEQVWIKKLKVELGTVATDWVPAYQDTDSRMTTIEQTATELTVRMTTAEGDILDAGKTATDYLNLSTAGLVVGQNPSNPSGGNTLISSEGITIRKGTTILSEFKAASRTASGISSATLTSTDSTDSESDGTTSVSGTVSKNETRANVYISTDGKPVYFPNGIETNKVLINDTSGIIANTNFLLNGSLVDNSGEGVFTPRNSYGNTILGYGRYQDGGGTHVYGTYVKAKTKNGFSASVNGVPAIDTNNDSGNATFGWHLYEKSTGETNIYGNIVGLFSKDDIRLNAAGNYIRANGSLVPYEANSFNLGAPSLSFSNIYFSSVKGSDMKGIRYANANGESYNAIGVNPDGYMVYGNTTYCTNIITKSTTTTNTGYSFKITCGDNPTLVLGDSDARLFFFGGTDSTSRYIGSCAAYKRTYTATSNMVITDNSIIGRVTSSSRRYKEDIDTLPIETVRELYKLPVRQFKYKDGYIASDDQRYKMDIPGFIAEEVFEHLPIACDLIKDSEGNMVPEMWNSNIIIPALLRLIQDLNNRLTNIEEK